MTHTQERESGSSYPLLNVGKAVTRGRKTGYPRRDQRASRVCGWGASGDVLSEGGKIFGIVSLPLEGRGCVIVNYNPYSSIFLYSVVSPTPQQAGSFRFYSRSYISRTFCICIFQRRSGRTRHRLRLPRHWVAGMFRGKESGVSTSPSAIIRLRSTTFRSSRTFPFQVYFSAG